jgi:hypothetical protein
MHLPSPARLAALVLVVATASAAPRALAQEPPATTPSEAPAAEAPPAEAAPAAPTGPEPTLANARATDEPSAGDARVVAYVSTGVTVLALAAGVTLGIVAQTQFDCIKDVVACNDVLVGQGAAPIVGDQLFDARAEVERYAVLADASYLISGVAAVVATAGYLAGFVFLNQDEPPAGAPAASAALPLVSPLALQAPASGVSP